MGNKAPALGAALVALGSLMLDSADWLMALPLGAWLIIGGMVLFVVGNPGPAAAIKQGQIPEIRG